MYHNQSQFTGGLSGLIGINILAFLITILTFGICYPWAVVMKIRWETKHTIIDGRSLRFDGTAMGLFGQYIKWLLLSFLTCGIYGFWLTIKVKQWVTKHTHFV